MGAQGKKRDSNLLATYPWHLMSATQSWEVWNILVATMHREITQSMMGTWGLGSLGLVFKATAAMLSFHQAEMGEWSREAGGCG